MLIPTRLQYTCYEKMKWGGDGDEIQIVRSCCPKSHALTTRHPKVLTHKQIPYIGAKKSKI